MKKIISLFAMIMMLAISTQLIAQENEFQTNKTTHTNSHNDKIASESSTIRSEYFYKFEANFVASKKAAIQQLLEERLTDMEFKIVEKNYQWTQEINGEELFYCNLKGNELRLSLNKKLATPDFYEKINTLGEDLQKLVATHDN